MNLRPDEVVVDSFAGGGGASTGIFQALGRHVDVAINHSRRALAVHAANHPETRHYCEDVWEVDPRVATQGRPVGLAWFSPDCTHHSRAKGAQPVKKAIRGLAGVVIKWARLVRPRVIILENVREFEDWGPLLPMLDGDGNPMLWPDGSPKMRPDPDRKGETFNAWVWSLRTLGYAVEWRSLNAADFGAPTHRRRLFLVARSDGLPIAWPTPTHGPGRALPYRTAAECIDWSLPCYSIFLTRAEARAAKLKCIRPLADNTMARVAAGVKRYVLENPKPFIVRCDHGGDHFRGQSNGKGNDQGERGNRIDEPLRTQTAANRFGLVTAFLAKHYGGVVGHELERPIGTVTSVDHHSLVAATLIKNNHGDKQAFAVDEPLRTVMAGANHHAMTLAFLSKYNGRSTGQGVDEPAHTVVGNDRFGLVLVEGVDFAIVDIGLRMLSPRELFRCQGFPDSYVIDLEVDGRRLSAGDQVELVGNSVSPDNAAAIVRANMIEGMEVACA